MHVLTLETPVTLEGVSLARRRIARSLRELRFDSGLIEDLALAVAELGANLVRHAAPRPERLSISAQVDGSAIRLEMADDGGAWPELPGRLDSARRMIASRDAEGGRGLMLIDLEAKDTLAGAAAYTRSVKIEGIGRGGKAREETLEIRSLNNAKAGRAKKGRVADLGFKPNRVSRVE